MCNLALLDAACVWGIVFPERLSIHERLLERTGARACESTGYVPELHSSSLQKRHAFTHMMRHISTPSSTNAGMSRIHRQLSICSQYLSGKVACACKRAGYVPSRRSALGHSVSGLSLVQQSESECVINDI